MRESNLSVYLPRRSGWTESQSRVGTLWSRPRAPYRQ